MKRILALALLLAALPAHAIIKSQPAASGAGGSVTSVSVVTANGFAGTVATATSTPAITLTTTVTGLIKGNGSAIAAAAAADVVALWSGTCSSATFLRGDGACAAVSLSTNVTGTLGVTNGGNGLATATLGDLRYGSAANTLAALAGNTTATKQFLTQTGTGSASAAPAWAGIVAGDLPAGVPTAAANPSASVGLTAVNGSATTFTRSDAAPALSLAINPIGANSFTSTWEWSLTEPRLLLNQSGAGTDLKLWDFDVASGVLTGRTRTDADGAGKTWLSVTRGTTTAVSIVTLGNASDAITYNFMNNGSGNGNFSGPIVAPRVVVTQTTVATNGIYLPAASTLGFGAGGTGVGTWTTTIFDVLTDFAVDTLGKGLQVKEGTNGKQGTCTLVGGTCTVTTTSVTANSRIFLTAQSLGTVAVPSGYGVSARTAGTSFTILASAPTDTSVVAYEIFEPAP